MRTFYMNLAALFFVAVSCPALAVPTAEPQQAKTIEEARVDTLVTTIHQEIVSKKTDRAKLLFLAAKKGNPKACNYVGWLFDHGIAVKPDSSKALKWFESCSRRNPLAAYNAAVLYAEGRGTDRNMDKAIMLFRKAWAIGGAGFHGQMPQIPIRLAYHHRRLKENAEAMEWAELAADLNAKHGKYLVARMMIEKTAPYSDDAKALNFLNAAVEAYSAPAASLLAWCYGTGRLSDKDLAMAYQYELIASKMDSRSPAFSNVRWGSNLSADSKQRAEGLANNWMATHKPAMAVDFKSTLDGTEEQFRK